MVIPIINNNGAEELSFASSSLSHQNFNNNNLNHSYFSSSVNTVQSGTTINSSTSSPMRSFSSASGGLYVSAPGKIILFGEHAVVFGRTAIAGSIDLRTYVSLFTSADGRIYLSLPDMDVEKTWMLKDLQKACERLAKFPIEEGPPSLDLIVPIARKLSGACEDQCGAQNLAILAFWYILIGVIQRKKDLLAVKVTVRFKLPPCVGLGSSGAFCVCIATALLQTAGLIPPPTIPTNFDGSLTWDECHLEVIRKWSAAAESLIHGRASGLDAAVCTYGGVASYKPGKRIENLQNIPNLKVILVNSKVERNTSRMVQYVKDKLDKFPHVIDNIFNAIDEISLAAAKILQRPLSLLDENGINIIENGGRISTFTPSLCGANSAPINELSDSNNLQLTLSNDRSSSLSSYIAKGKRGSTVSAVSCTSMCDFRTKLERNELTETFEKLNDLSRINNQLLISLGVGHAKIDQICILLGRYGIYPKMTGAGGGGSVFAFLKPDISQTILNMIREELKKEGYEMWQPLLGGPGVMCHTHKPDLFNFVNSSSSTPPTNIICNSLLTSRSNTPSSSHNSTPSNIRNKK